MFPRTLYTEEHLMFASSVRDFIKKEIEPNHARWEKAQMVSRESWEQLGEAGYLCMQVDEQYGGLGIKDFRYNAIIAEELGKLGLASEAVGYTLHSDIVCPYIEHYGTEEAKKKWLPQMVSGKAIAAIAMTEPGAGSDLQGMRTTAVDKGDHYLLNGTKNWITNGSTASYYLVIAQTYPEKGHKGINALIVHKDWPGVTVGAKENKLGIRGSDTHSIMFQDVKVPKENRIGEDGFGFKFAMKVLAGGRIGIASQALGIASGAYELALKYSKERKAFGTEISNHQAIAFKLADMATAVEAARLLCLKAAWTKDQGKDYTLPASIAKLYASDIAQWVTNEAVQVHGGYGYVKEFHVERLMRDAKITQIYEGTSEVQRIVISRSVLKD